MSQIDIRLVQRLAAALARMKHKYENYLDEDNISPREIDLRTWFATKILLEVEQLPEFNIGTHHALIRGLTSGGAGDPPETYCPHCKERAILYKCNECGRISCANIGCDTCHIPCSNTFKCPRDGWDKIKQYEQTHGKTYEAYTLITDPNAVKSTG